MLWVRKKKVVLLKKVVKLKYVKIFIWIFIVVYFLVWIFELDIKRFGFTVFLICYFLDKFGKLLNFFEF